MSGLMSILGWSFLPEMVSSFIHTVYYGITIRAGDPKPKSGSPKYTLHRRRIQIIVLTAYLVYTIYEAGRELDRQPSFYAELGVPLAATEREIKSRFRRLAALHHPDKTGSEAAADSTAYFMHLKLASDTLQDAAQRFAYERFGPAIISWDGCVTIREFVSQGVFKTILPHYFMIATTAYLLGSFGFMQSGHFYRLLIAMTLCLVEVHAATRPGFPPLLNFANTIVTTLTSRPPYLPFQLIELLRQLSFSMYFALSQIFPLLVPRHGTNKAPDENNERKAVQESLVALEAVSKQLETDAGRLMDMEIAPFKGDTPSIHTLRGQMREWLVQNTIRADPMVKDALRKALEKSREGVLAGEKGHR